MKKTYYEIVLDMKTLDTSTGHMDVISEVSFMDSRPVALCKDHGQDVANKQRQDELAMQQKAFEAQMAQLGDLKSSLSKYLTDGGQGFTPGQMSETRSAFLNQNALNYNAAGANVRSALAARGAGGGDGPVGGDYVRGISSLEGASASDRAAGLTGIDLQNIQQALTNKFNAASILSGNAATLNGTQGVAGSGASSALGQYVAAKSIPGFGEQFSGALAKGLGGGLATFATGGFGGVGSLVPTSAGGTKG